MNTPTRHAPHIWWNVLRKASPRRAVSSLPASASSAATMSHDARIAVPPTKGVKLNAAVMVALVSGTVAATLARNQLTLGSGDHGPVQAATTTTRTANGIHAWSTSLVLSP